MACNYFKASEAVCAATCSPSLIKVYEFRTIWVSWWEKENPYGSIGPSCQWQGVMVCRCHVLTLPQPKTSTFCHIMELLSKVLHTEVPGKGRRILVTCRFPEFLSSMCLLWLTFLATPSSLMWKQPVPAEQFHNTSSRRWIWRQNLHHNRLNMQLTEGADWNAGVQPPCVWQENPPEQIPGHDTSFHQPGEQLVLVLPYLLPCWIRPVAGSPFGHLLCFPPCCFGKKRATGPVEGGCSSKRGRAWKAFNFG